MSCVEVTSPKVTGIIGVNAGIGSDNFGIYGGDLGISCEDLRIDNVEMNSAHCGLETVEIIVFTGNVTGNVVTVVGCFDFIRLIIFEIAKTPLQNKNSAIFISLRFFLTRTRCY